MTDKIVIDLGAKFNAALATANRAIDALPDMPAADECAAIDLATVPIMAVVDHICAVSPNTPAGAGKRQQPENQIVTVFAQPNKKRGEIIAACPQKAAFRPTCTQGRRLF